MSNSSIKIQDQSIIGSKTTAYANISCPYCAQYTRYKLLEIEAATQAIAQCVEVVCSHCGTCHVFSLEPPVGVSYNQHLNVIFEIN